MKIKYKEDPRAWLKSTLLTVLGLVIVSSLLRWRHVLSSSVWLGVVAFLLCSRGRVHPTGSISRLLSVFDLGRLLVQPSCCVGGFDAHVFPHFLTCRVHHADTWKGPAASETRPRDGQLLGAGKKHQSTR